MQQANFGLLATASSDAEVLDAMMTAVRPNCCRNVCCINSTWLQNFGPEGKQARARSRFKTNERKYGIDLTACVCVFFAACLLCCG